jgi:hypothetical protein
MKAKPKFKAQADATTDILNAPLSKHVRASMADGDNIWFFSNMTPVRFLNITQFLHATNNTLIQI